MEITSEEKEADDRVVAALENWLRVNKYDGSADDDGIPRVLTDFVIFMATQGWKPDGDSVTGHPYHFRDGMPLYRSIGLTEVGLHFMRDILTNGDDEE